LVGPFRFTMRITAYILLLTVFMGCNADKKNDTKTEVFHLPTLYTPTIKDTVHYFETDSMAASEPVVMGKYKTSDTINVTYSNKHLTGFIGENRLRVCTDTLSSDGFEIIPDYKYYVPFKDYYRSYFYYYPVYIVNETTSSKLFQGKDNYMYAIQEAQDSFHSWYPVECRTFDFCGNGVYGLKVEPQEFVLCLFPKYKGHYKTLMRIRIVINGNVYLSVPFKGEINYGQFYPKRGMQSWLREYPGYAMSQFYGALPKDFYKWGSKATN